MSFYFQKFLDDFYKHFNGKLFNSLEDKICHLIYVGKVENVKASEVIQKEGIALGTEGVAMTQRVSQPNKGSERVKISLSFQEANMADFWQGYSDLVIKSLWIN